jgi:aspartate 1-decarboxylase
MLGQASKEGPSMWRAFCRAKLHRIVVTEAKLDYEGSISLDVDLMEAAALMPYEMVQITNLSNGTRWKTYAAPAPAGSGTVCLNGPPARLFHPGDLAIVVAQAWMTEAEASDLEVRLVFVDERNRITRVEKHRTQD